MRRRRMSLTNEGVFQVVSLDGSEPFVDFVIGFRKLASENRGDPGLVKDVRELNVNDNLFVGGGAAASFVVRRIA
jgi:hypothetical protein